MFYRFTGNILAIALLAAATISCVSAQPQVAGVDAVLNDLHDAASKGDFIRYFSHFADDAVFLGTDASERWTTSEFRAYAKSRFEHGGWTYTPIKRNVFLSKDGQVAWFDETVASKKYGNMRGTGVLVKSGTTWKLAQYNLLKPIPNDLFDKIVGLIETQRATK
jgi:ketosteroid isomerase-like protein